ncbi:hypothetical protein PARMER_02705 [Parabacteroides merdae ATCC 43184]|nr:hypothetical protein PARMER_02705 [Parabacteroides merdae ATCC 43184]
MECFICFHEEKITFLASENLFSMGRNKRFMPMEQNFPLYETAPKRVAVRPYQDRSWFHLADVSSKISL